MIPERLAAVLHRRFTVVAGKGGVGKTTTAGAIALWRADAGEPTHLVSVDPAHSLADVFGQSVGPLPVPAECAERLLLEELDAKGYAEGWMDRAGEPLAQLVERGTYLLPDEVEGFLRLAWPGIDEVAAALRLAELAEEGTTRIVVDTAPTGHLLRLLGAGDVLAGWISAFDAMRDKAAAVAEALAGTGVSFPADAVLDDLAARVDVFRDHVLADADFVVVGAMGEVVERETERLRRALTDRRLRVTAVVLTGGHAAASDGEPPVLGVLWRPLAPGCEDLRRWGAPADAEGRPRAGGAEATGGAAGEDRASSQAARGEGAIRGEPPAEGSEAILSLFRRELVLVAGKGGVGKSTCAAALAVALSRERRVALFGSDPAGSLGDVLGREVPPEGLAPSERLRIRELDAEAELETFREEHRQHLDDALERLGLESSLALDRRVLDRLWSLAPPGMDEVFALVRVLEAAGMQDTLVVDAAPTGHFLRLIAMPELARDWTRQLIRLMLNTRELAGLDDAAERLLGFARRVRSLMETLRDPARAGVLLVTLRGAVVEAETRRLAGALSESQIPIVATLENRWLPGGATGPNGEDEEPLAAGAPRIRAEATEPPPVGEDALLGFFASWTLVEPGAVDAPAGTPQDEARS